MWVELGLLVTVAASHALKRGEGHEVESLTMYPEMLETEGQDADYFEGMHDTVMYVDSSANLNSSQKVSGKQASVNLIRKEPKHGPAISVKVNSVGSAHIFLESEATGCLTIRAYSCGWQGIVSGGKPGMYAPLSKTLTPFGRGLNVATFNLQMTKVTSVKSFDMYGDSGSGQAMADFLNGQPPGTAIMVVCRDECATHRKEATIHAMKSYGATQFSKDGGLKFRGSYIYIGVKGDSAKGSRKIFESFKNNQMCIKRDQALPCPTTTTTTTTTTTKKPAAKSSSPSPAEISRSSISIIFFLAASVAGAL